MIIISASNLIVGAIWLTRRSGAPIAAIAILFPWWSMASELAIMTLGRAAFRLLNT